MIGVANEGYFVVDVDATNGAALVCFQPLVHAFGVEQVHAGKSTHILFLLKVAKTNRAFVGGVIAVRFPI